MSPRRRYRARKPIYAAGEDSLNPRFIKRLARNGWRYAPRRAGLTTPGGGHWVPPEFRRPTEATLSRTKGPMNQRRLTLNRLANRRPPKNFKKPFPSPTDHNPSPVTAVKNRRMRAPKRDRGVGPLGGIDRGGRRYL